MKLEFEIADIKREDVVDAIAEKILGPDYHDPEDGPVWRRDSLASFLKKAVANKIDELAAAAVRDAFDVVIEQRIAAAVDEVLAAGWQATNQYGEARGERLGLKERISAVLTERPGGYSDKLTRVEHLIADQVTKAMHGELGEEVKRAREALRAQLDGVIAGKFTEAIKSAMGLR